MNRYTDDLRCFPPWKVLSDPSPGSPLPELPYSFCQMEFAQDECSPVWYSLLWVTLIYYLLACWAWSVRGCEYTWSVLDYAGGGPTEIGSGVSGVSFSWVLGQRNERELLKFCSHNHVLGEPACGPRYMKLNNRWSMAGIVWSLLDYRLERKFCMVGFCSGTIAGLVAATPASERESLIMGVVVGAAANYGTKLKFSFLCTGMSHADLYAEHAIGPITVSIPPVPEDDSTTTGSNCPLHVHLCGNGTCIRYDTYARESYGSDSITESSSDAEALGMDDAQIGEFMNDYIEVLPLHSAYWTPACNSGTGDSDLHALRRWGPSWTPDTSMWRPQRRDRHVVNNHRERHLTPLSEKPQHEQQARLLI
ncbi:ammonium transporter AmtB-like domain-containing protein [Sparassis latifolia]